MRTAPSEELDLAEKKPDRGPALVGYAPVGKQVRRGRDSMDIKGGGVLVTNQAGDALC